MPARFVIKKAAGGKCMFNLLAGNSQVILTSESYNDMAGLKNGIASVQKNCHDDACFERKTAKDGSPYFTLKARNGQVIGKSQMYSSERAMNNGIASVKTNGPNTNLVDQIANPPAAKKSAKK